MGPFHPRAQPERTGVPASYDPRSLPPAPPSSRTAVSYGVPTPPRTHAKAVVALVLGLLSVVGCLGAVAGLPAIVLGAVARREIDRSGGGLGGRGLAAGGIVTGLFGTGVGFVVLLMLLGNALDPKSGEVARATDAPLRVPVASGTRSYGPLDVVDLDEAHSLRSQLAPISVKATRDGRVVVLQTYVRSSHECAQVAAALPDLRMQHALANVTLVRVDVSHFGRELRVMGVETDTVPWFYKLDGAAYPTDAISADEWDDNVPENMAPVLGPFVRGTLRSRRAPAPGSTLL